MDVRELRVGNSVNRRVSTKCGVELFVHNVTAGNIGTAASDGEIDFLEPIPLTPEILEACGFSSDLDGVQKKSINKFYDYQIMTVGLMDSFYLVQHGSAGIMPPCRYLHQLQNLYHSITGEELTYSHSLASSQ